MAYDLFETAEIWKPIPGYEGYCEASSFGRVRSLPRVVSCNRKEGVVERRIKGKVLSQTPDRGRYAYGRLQVKLVGPEGAKTHLVHRVVSAAFFGGCPEGMQVAHHDGRPENNRIENLRYATPAENTADKFRHGTVLRGSRVANSKLTEADVLYLRSRRSRGDLVADLAQEFGISIAQVSRICNGSRWVEINHA